MATVTLEVQIADELLQAFLQHLRNFDTLHDKEHRGLVHLSIGIEAPEIPSATMQEIFRNIRPPFECEYVLQGRGES